jgi:hypothetical protein
VSEEDNPFLAMFTPPPFESITALMKADAAGSLSDEELDRYLNWFLVRILQDPVDCAGVPEPVVTYWATGMIQADVLNGGFAQAAYNIPEWFGLAAEGYSRLDRPAAAERIRQAAQLSQRELQTVSWLRRRGAQIGAIFRHFQQSSLKALDRNLYEIGWDVTEQRRQLVRENRDAFAQLDFLKRDKPV